MTGVTLTSVDKVFGSAKIIDNVSMDIAKGEFAVFVGPSGCGKSTLLRMIAGLEETSAGTVEIESRDVTQVEPAQREVAMVFQSYALYPHLSVFDNMAFSLRLAKTPKQQITAQVNEAARILKIEEQLDKKPSKLSGGQRQRVAIGRAIVRQPKVFLFDEPLSNLDAELRVQMRLELSQLHRQLGSTMIYVTHDQVEAMTLADKIFVLRGGVVQQSGTPLALYDDPDNQFVAGFIGSPAMNFLTATISAVTREGVVASIEGSGGQTLEATLRDTSLDIGQNVVLGIRPEHLHIREEGFSATVEMTENLGGVAYLHSRLAGGQKIVIERRGERQAYQCESISVWADAKHVLVFDQGGQRLR
ncbi:sn-glycerol-3-phosphate ABC transporter ATP-binding protein UgpC [Halomonas aquamarina]|uniref:Sn-glycerol-3-phosphate ABC transporter ATP-binding protein UgpC n=1 Tax=Vreelandella aquamarina TaxID=77097 RepID=A0ACC5VXP4_9GAMM|nr:sn-glycerol-3-phosphate ABC transporter ATP-binding protein UgpC [Halomonas aquamarina]MBZ5488668.1 sn-glycerol-3-phosphate ABC transporter ATP-binding protein UgpC [Halomonas aquamarina]